VTSVSFDELRRAVARLDAAPQAGDDRVAILASWRALVDGQLALVSSFDADGQRFLIARRSSPAARAATRLTAAEAHALRLRAESTSYKVIAGELGLSTAAAHGLVRAGMRKLGVQDETELPWLFGRHIGAEPHSID
jgi:DNA-binding NarL/FixJ family response regulator